MLLFIEVHKNEREMSLVEELHQDNYFLEVGRAGTKTPGERGRVIVSEH